METGDSTPARRSISAQHAPACQDLHIYTPDLAGLSPTDYNAPSFTVPQHVAVFSVHTQRPWLCDDPCRLGPN